MFAQLYNCPTHGEVWHTEIAEEIDTENDEVYPHRVCSCCFSDVTEVLHNGMPCLHPLTEEEMFWEAYDPSERLLDEESEWDE